MNATPADARPKAEPPSQPRKLIVCIDGTANQFSEKNTNVVELYSRIRKDKSQLTYYNSGVGTYARPFWWSFAYLKQQAMGYIDLAIAWNFDQVVIGAYRWLSDNYQPGDQIFLFGFSRGAYQVRTLAGMIEKVGLIYPGNQEQIPFAWEVYSNDDPQSANFKKTFCRQDVGVYFVGVWDTVASVGAFSTKPFPLADQCSHITHFRHALALDELRVKFLPEHVLEQTALGGSLQQVWFVGTHSDIGGGNKVNTTLDRGGEPLKWMMEEAYARGLSLRLHDVKIGLPHAHVTDSMKGLLYRFLEIVPFLGWKSYLTDGEPRNLWRSHLMQPREVLPHQSIHWTVGASLEQGPEPTYSYKPKANLLVKSEILHKAEPVEIHNKVTVIPWDKRDLGVEEDGRPTWADNGKHARMVEILKTQKPDSFEARQKWLSRLYKHCFGDEVDESPEGTKGKPDAIWPYGGPKFLQYLFEHYSDVPIITESDSENPKTIVDIAQAIIGFDPSLNWNNLDSAPISDSGSSSDEPVQDIEKDLALRLRDMVIPRVSLLLEQWSAPYQKTKVSCPSFRERLRGLFTRQPTNTDDTNSVDANWNWDYVAKKDRSMRMARASVDVIVAIHKSAYAKVLQQSSGNLVQLLSSALRELTGTQPDIIETASGWKNENAVLAAGILGAVVALFQYDEPRVVCFSGGFAKIVVPLIRAREKHLELALQAMLTAGVLVQDYYCGIDVVSSEIIPELLGILKDNQSGSEPAKRQLAQGAISAVVTLSAHVLCCDELSKRKPFSVLFGLLKNGIYIDNILKVLKNISINYSRNFMRRHIGDLVGLMLQNPDAIVTLANIAGDETVERKVIRAFYETDVTSKVTTLLRREEDLYANPAARLVCNMVARGLNNRSGVESDIFQAIAFSLRVPFRSQETVEELLKASVRLALLGPLSDGLLAELKPLCLDGKKRAILASSASSAFDKTQHDSVHQYIPTVVEMVVADDDCLKESMEVLTVMVRNGYTLPGYSPKRLVDRLSLFLKSVYTGLLYNTEELAFYRDPVLILALNLFEVLAISSATQGYVIDLGLLGIVVLGLDSAYNSSYRQTNAVLDRLKGLIEPLRKKLKYQRSEDELAEEEQEDDKDDDECEDSDEEESDDVVSEEEQENEEADAEAGGTEENQDDGDDGENQYSEDEEAEETSPLMPRK